ncbi:MAG TPA: helix-turn-helix transcriptional regulator [Micromonosporaceae bacterium]|nr:helix-turn-helix transcriptional regulator [Micromonosporaceae bacterium]
MPRRTVVDPRFPARLRELREERGLSLRALAARTYSSKSHIRGERDHGRGAEPWETAELLRRMHASDTAPATIEALNSTAFELCCQTPEPKLVDGTGHTHPVNDGGHWSEEPTAAYPVDRPMTPGQQGRSRRRRWP